jgi:hypothetical protein
MRQLCPPLVAPTNGLLKLTSIDSGLGLGAPNGMDAVSRPIPVVFMTRLGSAS